MKLTHLVAGGIFAAMSLAGCDCNPKKGGGQVGEVGIVYDVSGQTVTGPDGIYDFGKVGMGTSPTMKVTIRNLGLVAIDLESVEKDTGENLKLGEGLNEQPPVFEMAFATRSLGAGETAEFDLTFHAPVETDQSIKTKDHQSSILLRAGNVEKGRETSKITFKGTAVSGSCNLPQTIDFGAVALNDSVKQSVPITNNAPLVATATVGQITSNSGDDLAFGFATESATGEFQVQSGATRDVVFTFKPTDVHDYFALVKMRAADQCPELNVKLIGSGVNQVLSCDPTPVDFGYLTPGLSTQKKLTLVNAGLTPVKITNALPKNGTAASNEYKLLGPDMFDVPGATRVNGTLTPGKLELNLTFTPSLLGIRQAALVGNTTLSQQPMLSCPLRGQGGGPDIDIKPAAMNFGKVPYFQGYNSFVTRKVTVQNLGTSPTPPDNNANLHLGMVGGGKVWDIVGKNPDSLATDICVGVYDAVANPTSPCLNALPANYDPVVGIKAAGTAALLDIPVRIQPHAANLSLEWDVTFYSNDPDEPAVTINIKAQSVVLPPCNYQVTPTSLNFGLVTPPQYRDLGFQIKNLGMNANETCLITHLEMKAGSDAIFTLPGGPLDQVEIQPGGVQNVLVRAWPQGTVSTTVQQVIGTVTFGISSPTAPQKDVALSASIATSCLTINPSDLDFGTVKKNCNSPRKVFNIYNTCTTGVTVNSYQMLAAAGAAPGSMYCPGTMICPEFLLDGTPGFSMGTVIQPGNSMPVTFALKYKPLDDGPDTGAFLIKVTQNGQVVDYVITLRGVGDNFGLNTDTFRQDSKPKADILLVIDDSGSMSDKQMSLGTNFASFIRYANTAGVDYHIGVVPTEIGAARQGLLIGDASNPKVLTPQTPNVENLFKQKVIVGLNGGYEGMACMAVMALTAPFITNQNAGFLRPDAILAVVAVTDAADQCPAAASIYENQLRNIKGAQHANQFSYNVIGPFLPSAPSGCSYDEASPDVSKHLYLINQFNGVKEEICTPNWSTALENLGKTAFGYRTNFFLTAEPDLTGGNTIVVKIDDGMGGGPVVLPPVDARGAPVWSYDSVSNSIVFQPLFVPSPGDVMTVTYHVACL